MKLTQTDRREIVAQLQAKQTTMTGLAEKHKVSIAAIGYVFKKMTGRGLKPQLSQSARKAIVTELQSGKTTEAELADKYGVAPGTIYRTYKKETGESWKPRLPDTDKNAIVAELLAGKAKKELVAEYGVSKDTIERTFVRQIGHPITTYKKMVKTALKNSRYRAWHTGEKKMYAVLGLDWFNQKVLIEASGTTAWQGIAYFIIMEYSGLRDRKRIPEYPWGQEICVGDIVQFPINLDGKETIVKDVIGFENGQFVLSERTDCDPLALHSDECEIIGNIYEKPELMSEAA